MNQEVIYTFQGANQDITKSKHSPQYYFDAAHINILATDTQSTGSIVNEKGNKQVISIPEVQINSGKTITYNGKTTPFLSEELASQSPKSIIDSKIIGHTTTRDSIILFTTDDNGGDCIWEVKGVLTGEYSIDLLYTRELTFSTSNLIQALFNYENESIQKVYWVDGVNQIRNINIKNDEDTYNDPLIDTPSTSLNSVGTIEFSQPIIKDKLSGGIHTSGMVQYAYNLYRLNGSQTKISPLSGLVSLDKGNLGGGELNEVVGSIPVVEINDIDLSYTNIKVYAIKYTSYNQTPSISLIKELELSSKNTITVYDDGSTLEDLSLEEFLFLGGNPTKPKHIVSKDNRLFTANYKDYSFDVPAELDCRAYSFTSTGLCKILSEATVTTSNGQTVVTGPTLDVNNNYTVPLKHAAINPNYDTYRYQRNGVFLGGEGKYIEYKFNIVSESQLSKDKEDCQFFKDRELYRIGIQFYNRLGQTSLPKWIADFKAPNVNLQGLYATLNVALKPEFYTWLNSYNFESEDDKPIGYRILRADRTLNDKTIICQGILSSMMVNSPDITVFEGGDRVNINKARTDSSTQPKYPNFVMRTHEEINPLKPVEHFRRMQWDDTTTSGTRNRLTEIQYSHNNSSEREVATYQYTTMQQMYSPEITFTNPSLSDSNRLNIIGGALNTTNNVWAQERDIDTKEIQRNGKGLNGVIPGAPNVTNVDIKGSATDLMDRGMISDTNGSVADENVEFVQWYREFNDFQVANKISDYKIYGVPEVTERGQGNTLYNNDPNFEYRNSFEGFSTDGEDEFKDDGSLKRRIISLNSFGAKCITIVTDKEGFTPSTNPWERFTLEQLYKNTNISNTNVALVGEITKPWSDVYIGTIYGGNSYEDKKRTTYIEIGSYSDIEESSIQIDSPGDTFINYFQFERVAKTDTEVYSVGINQITEIVRFKVETSIDLKNRNDQSFSNWDSDFQPRYDDYHKYNTVYSQQPTLVRTTDVDYNFKRIQDFDTRIQSSKLKIPNESIDSWTDMLINETMDLDGKYGPLSTLVSFNDNIYSFQDSGIALISINPRVQVQGNDGIGIELGTGGILYDYNYITDKSGSINKWSVNTSKKGIYYYDALNKAVGRVPDYTKALLTDVKGLHTFFNNNYNFKDISIDNPVLGKGVIIGTDNYNNDIFVTLLQENNNFTWRFDEESDTFIDQKFYYPSSYIYKGERLLCISPNNADLWEQYLGEYNNYFGDYIPSYVTLIVNPGSNINVICDNIMYNSEIYLDDIYQPDKSLTHIQAYNEYQDSGRIPLILGRGTNLHKMLRTWRANIPRDGRSRIRNPWVFLKLELDNTSNYKMILHDIIVKYTI